MKFCNAKSSPYARVFYVIGEWNAGACDITTHICLFWYNLYLGMGAFMHNYIKLDECVAVWNRKVEVTICV